VRGAIQDRDSTGVYTAFEIGDNMAETPEGFLLCKNVPIARTGKMIYGPGETPVSTGDAGYVVIDRDAEDLFDEETIASYWGKPVCDDHPTEDVTPDNWRLLSRGVTLNPRRGTGSQADLLLADLLITDRATIRVIRDKEKREVSPGYDADYKEISPGHGRQRRIRANHVALVDRGRCGTRCSIADKVGPRGSRIETIADRKTETPMVRTTDKATGWKAVRDRILGAWDGKDKTALDAALKDAKKLVKDEHEEEGEGEHQHIHIHTGEAKDADPMEEIKSTMDSLATDVKKIADRLEKVEDKIKGKDGEGSLEITIPEGAEHGAGTDRRGAKDSAAFEEPFGETISLAEILVPGIRVPTFDRASDPKKTLDAMCKLRRDALELGYADKDTRPVIDQVIGGKALDLKSMTCDAVKPIFLAAANVKRALNSAKSTDMTGHTKHGQPSLPHTISDMNRAADEYWSKQPRVGS